MSLTPGTRLGPYEIVSPIGAGGMGEVYRARDTNLNRDVAVKILPDSFAADADRVARFKREAQVLASLNHPNIAHIHGLEEANGVRALVMELVEGEDLSVHIARGAIPLADALPIAKQIADALEAAHELGIVHRDLKPQNIKVRADGTVKVLDFGLAKALDPAGASSADAMNSPTLTARMTQMGMILGTAAYMAPEQAKGKPVDRRADIWAFGVVLHEMLTGAHLFLADTIPETLAHVMTRQIDLSTMPASTPRRVRDLIARCLEKDPKKRLRDIGEARIRLEEVISGGADDKNEPTSPAGAVGAVSAGSPTRVHIAWGAAALFALLAGVAGTWALLPRATPPEMRLEITTPATDAPLEFALSPDNRYIAFVASGTGSKRLWLRALDKTDAQPLPGTEGADFPFWSPNSRSIGFFASSKLYRIDIAGGPPQFLANSPLGRGGAWNADGTILFAPLNSTALSRIAASGGEPSVVTKLDVPRQLGHRFPQFLPDGRHFLFYATGNPEGAGIYLASLDGGAPKRLTAADTAGAYLAPDRIVYVRQGTLVARHLDIGRGELTGESVTLADSVGYDTAFNVGGFSVSADGRVAYRVGGAGKSQLTWFDHTGKATGAVGEADGNALLSPELSPDGRRVAVGRTVQGNQDIFLMDRVRGGLTRLTFDAAIDFNPVWSRDGTEIAFSSNRSGVFNIYAKPSSGAGDETLLLESPNTKVVQDWSKDFLLYYELNPKTGRDLWALDVKGKDRKPRAVASTPYEETMAQFSPDGRWVAYQTNESTRFEIVVQAFPEPSGKWQVSTGGGVSPRWRADGKALYFVAPDGKLMAATVTSADASVEAGTPTALFPTRIVGGGSVATNRPQYAVRDGQFLINQQVAESNLSPITLLLNWHPDQKK